MQKSFIFLQLLWEKNLLQHSILIFRNSNQFDLQVQRLYIYQVECIEADLAITRKYSLHGYILGVLMVGTEIGVGGTPERGCKITFVFLASEAPLCTKFQNLIYLFDQSLSVR